MAKKSEQKAYWDHVIRRDKTKALLRINMRLFKNLNETFAYLDAFYATFSGTRRSPRQAELLSLARKAFRELPYEERCAVTQYIVSKKKEGMITLLMGVRHDEIDASKEICEFLLRLSDDENRILGHGKIFAGAHCLAGLMQAAGQKKSRTWTNALRHMYSTGDSSILTRFIEIISTGFVIAIDIHSIESWSESQASITSDKGRKTLHIPVPDDLVVWAGKVRDDFIEKVHHKDAGIVQLAQSLGDRIDEHRNRYEDMWLEMMIQPKWALRSNWLDAATIAIPELKQAGYEFIRLLPLEPFPNFRAQFMRKRAVQGKNLIQIDLEPSDLTFIAKKGVAPEDEILYRVDQLLAFIAVQVSWMIVMGKLPKTKCGGRRPSYRNDAVVRPRFRRLPNGHCASDEARARALEQFCREPLLGFTFVREYTRGSEPHSGQPLFSISIVDTEP